MALIVEAPSILKSGSLGFAVIVMGVSGSGKSTIGSMLANTLGCEFLDADRFHSKMNIEKMKNGQALTDEDRRPWLELLRDILSSYLMRGERVVLACSALRTSYRDILRGAVPKGDAQLKDTKHMIFVHLKPSELLVSRLEARFSDGVHYMPPSLLKSQIACLEMHADEQDIVEVDTNTEPRSIVEDAIGKLSKLARHLSVDHRHPEAKRK